MTIKQAAFVFTMLLFMQGTGFCRSLFSADVEEAIFRKLDVLEEYLESDEFMGDLGSLAKASPAVALGKIGPLEEAWRAGTKAGSLADNILNNNLSQKLKAFNTHRKEFSEIFITDTGGRLVGATNMTSDYYQADELWWQQTYGNGEGRVHYGDIEYDTSSETEGVPCYLPVKDRNGKIIGILKAILAIEALDQ